MELVGIADVAPTLSIRALKEKGIRGANGAPYDLYLVERPVKRIGTGLSGERHTLLMT